MRLGEGNDKECTPEGEKTKGMRFSMDAERDSNKGKCSRMQKRGKDKDRNGQMLGESQTHV
jgi:hypothetical protein